MPRVLALGCLAALFLAGSFAWAEDAAPPAPPAPPGGAALGSSMPVPPPPSPVEAAPTLTTMSGDGVSMSAAMMTSEISSDTVLRAARPGDTERAGSPWSGNLRLRYRLRKTDDDYSAYKTDQDLFGYLKVRYRDESLPGLSGSFHGGAIWDIDHFGNVDGYNTFDSVWDTFSNPVNGLIYHLYLNYRICNSPLETVRIGRIWEDVGEFVTFDGVLLESARMGRGQFGVAALVGAPVYLFEPSYSGDFLGGLQAYGKPWRGGEVEFDWTYIEDKNVYGTRKNNLFNAVLNQRVGQYSLARFQYQQIDDQPRLFRGLIDAVWPNADAVVRAHFNTLFNPQAELVYDLDAYYWVALDLEPYWDAHVSASKGLGTCFNVEGGITLRRLYDTADEGRYNREWERYYLAASSFDWLMQGLGLTLSGELWSGSDDVGTAIFDVEYRPSRIWRFVLGTDYAAYSFDMWAEEERQNVYGVYGRVLWRPTPRWNLGARARVEDDDFGTYLIFDATAQLNF